MLHIPTGKAAYFAVLGHEKTLMLPFRAFRQSSSSEHACRSRVAKVVCGVILRAAIAANSSNLCIYFFIL